MGSEQQVARELRVVESHYITEHGRQTDHRLANSDGDMGEDALPDAVTAQVAEQVWGEFGIDVEDHGIEVVDDG